MEEILEEILKFRDERGWRKFHKPKELAASIAIEVGELLEVFQWLSEEEVKKLLEENEGFRERLREEIADILIYTLILAHETGIEPREAILRKIEVNRRKYPVNEYYGVARMDLLEGRKVE